MACECCKCNPIPHEVDVDAFRPGINQSVEVWEELVDIQEANPDQFLVWYRGPGLHPDHPESSCANCGHLSECGTHNIPAYPSEPCTCMERRTQ